MTKYIANLNFKRLYLIASVLILLASIVGYFTVNDISDGEKLNLATMSNVMFHLWFILTGYGAKLIVELGFEKFGQNVDSNLWLRFTSISLLIFSLWSLYNITSESIMVGNYYNLWFIGRPIGLLFAALFLSLYLEQKKLKTPYNNG